MSVTVKMAERSKREFDRTLRRMLTELGKDSAVVLKGHLRQLTLSFMSWTGPRMKGGRGKTKSGGKPADRREGARKINLFVRMLYKGIGHGQRELKRKHGAGVAAQFVRLMRKRRFAEVNALLARYPITFAGGVPRAGEWDDGALHDRARAGRRAGVLIVPNYAKVNALVRKEIKKVGFTKAAFVPAMLAFGSTRGVPKWVLKHSSKPGSGWWRQRKNGISAGIVVTLGYLSQKDYAYILRSRTAVMEKDLARIEKKGKYRKMVR